MPERATGALLVTVEVQIPSKLSAAEREAYEHLQFESEVYASLLEAERQAESTSQRFSPREVLERLRVVAHESPSEKAAAVV